MSAEIYPPSVPTAPRVNLHDLRFVGHGLSRPECVLTTRNGDIYAADWRGGVAHIRPDGTQFLYTAALPNNRPLRPNGIALRQDGSFLLADLGEELGGLFLMTRDGQISTVFDHVDGIELPPSNFVHQDRQGRLWLTVSTRQRPRSLAYRSDISDGFIVMIDIAGARIVADGLAYTNEVAVSPDGQFLYVNETFGRRLSRFRILPNGDLCEREIITQFGKGTFPDGLTFDVEGGVWITSIVSNRVIRVAADGSQTLFIEDVDEHHLEWCEDAFLSGSMGRQHLDKSAGSVLKNISSLAFGGPDLRTAFLGCLLGDSVVSFRTPFVGHPPVHWSW